MSSARQIALCGEGPSASLDDLLLRANLPVAEHELGGCAVSLIAEVSNMNTNQVGSRFEGACYLCLCRTLELLLGEQTVEAPRAKALRSRFFRIDLSMGHYCMSYRHRNTS